jgi:hypothetical protein
MFKPNLWCDVERVTGSTGAGKRAYGPKQRTRTAIVNLTQLSQPTSVRTDSSGSHAAAMDELAMSRILFKSSVPEPHDGDKVTIYPGNDFANPFTILTVKSVFPQHDVRGRFDHWQIDCTIWKG